MGKNEYNNRSHSRSLDSHFKPDTLISKNVGIVSDTNSLIDQNEEDIRRNDQNMPLNHNNGLIFDVNRNEYNTPTPATEMHKMTGTVIRDKTDLDTAMSSGGDSDVTLDSYSESDSNDESLNFSSDEDDTEFQSGDVVKEQFQSNTSNDLNINESNAINSSNKRGDTNENDSESLNFSTSEEEELSAEEDNGSNLGRISTRIITENQTVAKDFQIEENRETNDVEDTQKNGLNDKNLGVNVTPFPPDTEEDKSIQNSQHSQYSTPKESSKHKSNDEENEIQKSKNESLTVTNVNLNQSRLSAINGMNIPQKKNHYADENKTTRDQGQNCNGKTIISNSKKQLNQESTPAPDDKLVAMNYTGTKNLSQYSMKSNIAEVTNKCKEKEEDKDKNDDGLMDIDGEHSMQKSDNKKNFSCWKRKSHKESLVKSEKKKDDATLNAQEFSLSTSQTKGDPKTSKINPVKLSVKMSTDPKLHDNNDSGVLKKKKNRKESQLTDKIRANNETSNDAKGSGKRVSFSNVEEKVGELNRKSSAQRKRDPHYRSTHPYIGKKVRISEGKYEGVTGRIKQVRSKGWWILDCPALKNRKIPSGQCELIEKVPEKALGDYYRKKEMKSKQLQISQKSKNVSRSKKNMIQNKKRKTVPISEVQSLARDRHTRILIGDGSNSVMLRRRQKPSHYTNDNSLSSSSESSKDFYTTSIHSQITRKKKKKNGETNLNPSPKKLIHNNFGIEKITDFEKDMYCKPDVITQKWSNMTKKDDRNLQNVSNSSTGRSKGNETVETEGQKRNTFTSSTLNNKPILNILPVGSTRDGNRLLNQSVNPPIIIDALNNTVPSALKHLPPDLKVDIFDRKTCKILSGTDAVAIKDLPKLLRLHAEYEPIIPPHGTSSTRTITPIQRQGRTSTNIRVSETINQQARVISSASIGRKVMVKNGQYRGALGKISQTMAGGWVMVSGLNKLNLDVVFHSTQLETISCNKSNNIRQDAQKIEKSKSIGKEKTTVTQSMFKAFFDEHIRVPYQSLSLQMKAIEEEKEKVVKQMFSTVKNDLLEQDSISKEVGISLDDPQCKSSLSPKKMEGSNAQYLREELTLIENRMAVIKKELSDHIVAVKMIRNDTLCEFKRILKTG